MVRLGRRKIGEKLSESLVYGAHGVSTPVSLEPQIQRIGLVL